MNILEKIQRVYDTGTADAVSSTLHHLQMPVPGAEEYTTSWDDGFLVFLNHHGCVIRMTDQDKLPGLEDPAILVPLASRMAGRLKIDINPGLECPVDPRDAMALSEQLKTRGVNLWDQKTHNCGYLPALPGLSRRIPVVIDPCAVHALSESTGLVRNLISAKTILVNVAQKLNLPEQAPPPSANPSHQDQVFGSLRQAFQAAWSTDQKQPSARKINDFWKSCRASFEKGLLTTSWLSSDMQESGYKNAYKGSKDFAERWSGPSLN